MILSNEQKIIYLANLVAMARADKAMRVLTISIFISLLLCPAIGYSAQCKVDGKWYPYSSAECRNNKVKSNTVRKSYSAPPQSGRPTTKGGHIACTKESWLDDIVTFVAARDLDSVDAYLKSKKCIILKKGLNVTVTEYPSMFGGKTEFAFKGIKLWTVREAIDY